MNDAPVRFGLIGYGLFGKHHAHAICTTQGAELAAIAVQSASSQQRARGDHPGIDVYGDYRELLARPDIQVVNVVVPNHLHYEVASAALEAGKHLLLEKPMALKVSDCDHLLEIARRRKLLIAINHELRHSPLWGEVKRLIQQRVVGRPQYVLVELSRFPYRSGSDGWRWDIDRVGNWILEEPIHFFDLARWYLSDAGEPVTIFARANSRHPEHPELRDNFSAIVSHGDGSYAVISQSLAAFGHHVTIKIGCTEGMIWGHWSASDARSNQPEFSLQYGLGDNVQQVEFTKSTGELLELADQVAMLVQCVKKTEPPLCTGDDGRWSTLLCLAAEHSVETNNMILLDSFAKL